MTEGKWMAVKVLDGQPDDDRWRYIVAPRSVVGRFEVPASALHPLPVNMPPEAQAVLDAVGALRVIFRYALPNDVGHAEIRSIIGAYDDYLATLAPPTPVDPIEELQMAWREVQKPLPLDEFHERMEKAIAAVLAARGGK